MNINALSSSAALSKPNRFKYNGNEEQTDFDLGWSDFNARSYDSQLGRFLQIDPLSDNMVQVGLSPYQFGWNNPIRYNDPSGLCPICPALPWVVTGVEALLAVVPPIIWSHQKYKNTKHKGWFLTSLYLFQVNLRFQSVLKSGLKRKYKGQCLLSAVNYLVAKKVSNSRSRLQRERMRKAFITHIKHLNQ